MTNDTFRPGNGRVVKEPLYVIPFFFREYRYCVPGFSFSIRPISICSGLPGTAFLLIEIRIPLSAGDTAKEGVFEISVPDGFITQITFAELVDTSTVYGVRYIVESVPETVPLTVTTEHSIKMIARIVIYLLVFHSTFFSENTYYPSTKAGRYPPFLLVKIKEVSIDKQGIRMFY